MSEHPPPRFSFFARINTLAKNAYFYLYDMSKLAFKHSFSQKCIEKLSRNRKFSHQKEIIWESTGPIILKLGYNVYPRVLRDLCRNFDRFSGRLRRTCILFYTHSVLCGLLYAIVSSEPSILAFVRLSVTLKVMVSSHHRIS